MDAQSNTQEVAVRATTMEAGAVEPAVHDSVDLMELLDLHDLEAALRDHDFASLDLEESVRAALAEIAAASDAGEDVVDESAEPVVEETAAVADEEPAAPLDAIELEPALAGPDAEPAVLQGSSPAMPAEALSEPTDAPDSAREIAVPVMAATAVEEAEIAGESLETVEFELALQNQNLVSLGF